MKPLEGVKVVELATYLAAPSCCKILADWGADVIKVEPPKGDVYRYLGSSQRIPTFDEGAPSYDMENANKKFVALNVKDPKGMEAFLKLVEQADVLVTNTRPKALKKLGISYEDLKPKFPKLIFADILGYGEQGPDKDKPGFDYTTFYAKTGMMGDLAARGGDILNTIPGLGDHVAGAMLAGGICAALYRRSVCGQGDRVDVGLYQAGIFVMSCGILQTYFGREYPRTRYEAGHPTSNTYKCKDGEWIYLAATDYDGQWGPLCTKVLNRPDLAENPKYSTLKAVIKNIPEAVQELDRIFATQDSTYWLDLLKKADVAHERVAHFKDVNTDEQALVNNYIREYVYPGGEKVMFPNTPISIESAGDAPFVHASPVGSDTRAVLEQAGYSSDEVTAMIEGGAVRG